MMQAQEKEFITDAVADIMINDGPDGHCDGAEVIADFIEAYVNGLGKEWLENYYKTKSRHL